MTVTPVKLAICVLLAFFLGLEQGSNISDQFRTVARVGWILSLVIAWIYILASIFNL